MGLFNGNFWKGGLGKAVRGGLSVVTGGLSETAEGIIDQIIPSGSGGGETSTSKGGINGIQHRKSVGGNANNRISAVGRTFSTASANNMIARNKPKFYEKAINWVKSNVVATVSVAGGVLFLLLRTWQMGKPKAKRWGMFK